MKREDNGQLKIVIGLGTGRCGTVSLQRMLNQLDSSFFTHRGFMLPWYGEKSAAVKKMRVFLQETNKRVVGDIGFYWLPYVEEMIKNFPGIKFVCLKRNRRETIKSFMKETEGRNHWMRHDGTIWKRDVIWDRCYPKFDAVSKEQALEMYWDTYYSEAERLERMYSSSFKIFSIDMLSSSESFQEILRFIGLGPQVVTPVGGNGSSSGPGAGPENFLEKMYVRIMVDRKILPWRIEKVLRKRGTILNTILFAPFRRIFVLNKKYLSTSKDIDVVIPIRNIEPFRLYHALCSVSKQIYSYGSVQAIVVDYGSDRIVRQEAEGICSRFKTKYIYIHTEGPWNKARALNIGIKSSASTFIVSSDVDIMFSEHFFESAVRLLLQYPLGVVYSYCLDLPEETNDLLIRAYNSDEIVEMEGLRSVAVKRWERLSYGIHVTFRRYYEYINGYDETYEGWGKEDDDLLRRFVWLGLDPLTLYDSSSYYCHIWHEKWGGLITEKKEKMMKRNKTYFETGGRMIGEC